MPATPRFTFIDLFAGIGGFHVALSDLGGKCVLACEIDRAARQAYEANFRRTEPELFENGMFFEDVRTLKGDALDRVGHFDILTAGFPCQPFSQAGKKQGFDDSKDRGNLFFDIMDITEQSRPYVLFLENVRNLASIHGGKTFKRIAEEITDRGYVMYYQVIKASEHGLPQHRPRVYIVAFRGDVMEKAEKAGMAFEFPGPIPLEMTMSDIWGGQCDRRIGYTLRVGGRNSPFGDRHNWDGYLVDGEVRRLGPIQGRTMMGYSPDHVLAASETKAMKQLGNSVAVPVVRRIGEQILKVLAAIQ
jgi:DNA (cytosine-5)-methyltransferase 1